MFRILSTVLFSSDFWIMLFLNTMLTVMVNGVFDYFAIRNAWASDKRSFTAFELESVITFFAINAFLVGINRQRQIKLIKEEVLPALPSSEYSGVLNSIFFFSLGLTKPLVRECAIALNAAIYVFSLYFGAKEVISSFNLRCTKFTGVRNYGPCMSCAVFAEACWKSVVFGILYFFTYAASLNESQPEMKEENDNKGEKSKKE